MKVKIGQRLIGDREPCFIIAEAGVNHNGDVRLAKKLIDAAQKAGADAVKFQTFKAETVVSVTAEKAGYQKETTGADESQLDMLKRLELTESQFTELARYARQKGIMFLSTTYDLRSIDFIDELGVPAFKVASADIVHLPLLTHIARKGKPVILGTGMSTLEEIEYALQAMRKEGADEIILLHCVTAYPARIEDTNLRAMETLRKAFHVPVGLSDHTTGITVPIAAAALGACVIEKHFTLDKTLPGPDHRASLDPGELAEMVRSIRLVEKALGSGVKKPTPTEEENKKVMRRSLTARVAIPCGTVITADMIDIKRPGTSISPAELEKVIGRKASKSISQEEVLTWDKVD
jgi:N,N'-diacetyllegionaminate synthase